MIKSKSTKVIIVLGPTSSGKSDLAIQLAQQFNGEIISADSRQIYQDMNLASGKVKGVWENHVFVSENVAHHLIDFLPPTEEYNISHFKSDCYRLINEIANRGKLPIICGGTGFWISAVVDNVVLPEVKPDPELRKELSEKSAPELFEILKKLDPMRASTIDAKNKVRLIRAIEIAKVLGKVPRLKSKESFFTKAYRFLLTQSRPLPVIRQKLSCPDASSDDASISTCGVVYRNVEFLQLGIDFPKEILEQRIKMRIEQRMQAGMVEEVKTLKETYDLSWEKVQSFGLGYYWIPLYLQNQITQAQLEEKILIAERGYAKRQRTWFKKDKRILWLDSLEKAIGVTERFLGIKNK